MRKQTTIRPRGKNAFDISFSNSDGKRLADHIKAGGSLGDLLSSKFELSPPAHKTLHTEIPAHPCI